MKANRVITVVAAGALLLAGKAMAGGAIGIQWDNDGSQNNGPFVFESANDASGQSGLAIGDLVQLVAKTGPSSFSVLASTTIGTDASELGNFGLAGMPGYFDVDTAVASNVMASVVNDPLGVVYYDGTSSTAPYGFVYNPTILALSPSYVAPPFTTIDEPDSTDPNWVVLSGNGATSAGEISEGLGDANNDQGAFYVVAVPEPSSIALVVMGLLGGIGMIRRRRS